MCNQVLVNNTSTLLYVRSRLPEALRQVVCLDIDRLAARRANRCMGSRNGRSVTARTAAGFSAAPLAKTPCTHSASPLCWGRRAARHAR